MKNKIKIYICNPEENTLCSKGPYCKIDCFSTTNKDFAARDKRGKPIEDLKLKRLKRLDIRRCEKQRRRLLKYEKKIIGSIQSSNKKMTIEQFNMWASIMKESTDEETLKQLVERISQLMEG